MLKILLGRKLKSRILLVLMLFFLFGCSPDISESLFIASIGFEIENDELNGYFYLPLSNDVGKSEGEGKGTGEYVRVAGKTIEEVFNNVKAVSIIFNNQLFTWSRLFNRNL